MNKVQGNFREKIDEIKIDVQYFSQECTSSILRGAFRIKRNEYFFSS